MASKPFSTIVAATVLGFVVTLVPGGATTSAAASPATVAPSIAVPGAVAPVAKKAAKSAKAKAKAKKKRQKRRANYTVKSGVTFSSPIAKTKAERFVIIRQVNQAIKNTRRGDEIRIFSWKVWTRAGVTALLKAQKRGVQVRVIMDEKNTIVEDNPHFWRLKRGLRAGNSHRKAKKKSAAKLCHKSCRGKGGSAHSKFMLFSRAGKSKWVYMHSSANWGDPAAIRQWNDMYTFVGNKNIYHAATKVFDEAWKDKPVKPPWREWSSKNGKTVLAWSPFNKKARKNDRLRKTLKQVKCTGAQAPAGNANGRTIIRSAPDVIRGAWGMKIAKILRRKWNQGCDVAIGYTVMGIDVNRLLRANTGRGPVPMKHLTQDFDGDGIFDRYFHLKAWTINGKIGNNPTAYFLQTGSSNISQLALRSDETFMYFINRPAPTKRYQKHIDYWFRHFQTIK